MVNAQQYAEIQGLANTSIRYQLAILTDANNQYQLEDILQSTK